jgi:magnesium transporter
VTINVRAYDGAGVEHVKDPALISDLVGRKKLLWVDVVDASDEDFRCIAEEFELHHLAMEDARKHGQRPKLEQYPTHAFVVAYTAELAEVDLFVGPDWLVTVRERAEEASEARFERTRDTEPSVGFLLYTILDEIVDGYFGCAEAFEDRIEDLEERILDDEAGNDRGIQGELLVLRRELVEFRRKVVPLRDVIQSLLRGDVVWVDDSARVHLQDVLDHVLRAVDQLDSERELVGNAVDAHLAIASNRMNQVMKRMTSWGAILLGSTLVAGIYGMNFLHMPELEWRFGYYWALGLMLAVTVVGYSYFKRKDWL